MADGDLALLMVLRVQGVSPLARAATALGVSEDDAAARTRGITDQGLATERSGRVSGFSLTLEGVERLNDLIVAEGMRDDDQLLEGYERFLAVNDRVLQASSDWQVRREGGLEVANDHSDADYDAKVIDRLAGLHDRVKVCMDKISACLPRFATYRARLDDCVDRLLNGDTTAFTAPLAESYHKVWFELHQDLLLTLGLERES